MAEPDLMADTSIWDVPGQPSPVDTIYKSLNQALGTAYDTSDTSPVTAETKAEARILAATWRNNRRMALQWDPRYMTDFIPRWEAIFGIHPAHGSSDSARRTVLQARFKLLAGRSSFTDLATSLLGSNLVAIERGDLSNNYLRWPDNGFPNDWISHTAHILVRVQFLGGQTEISMLKLVGAARAVLEDAMPAWCTLDFATFAEDGSSRFILDDPNGAGPPPHNLNWEALS